MKNKKISLDLNEKYLQELEKLKKILKEEYEKEGKVFVEENWTTAQTIRYAIAWSTRMHELKREGAWKFI